MKLHLFIFTFLLSCTLRAELCDTALIRLHMTRITKDSVFRTHTNTERLNRVADYITSVFALYSDSVSVQEFTARGRTYKNVVCSFGTGNTKRIILGAHYDVCGEQEGADDNASGVTGLLELARLLKGQNLRHRIDLVAYSLEEPPYFRSEYMGSFIHARSLSVNKANVYGMVSLEMIGYFSDVKGSQQYPVKALSALYGKTGDYITIVRKFGKGKFARRFTRHYKRVSSIKTKKFTAPVSLPGIDFSDHLNYWHFDYSALMLTDTSFYRNKNYHTKGDVLETLDLYRMGLVIEGVLKTLQKL